MASRRGDYKEDAKLRIMQILNKNPQITSREIAQKIGISNGAAYYMIISLVDKGFIKFSNFKENSKKVRYCYYLTPKGIREKSLLTQKFLIRKKKEYKILKEEINKLEQEADFDIKLYNNE